MLRRLLFLIDPVPASRPRVSKWGTYYQKTYRNFKEAMPEIVQDAWIWDTFEEPCVLVLEIIKRKPKTTKLAFPSPDIDNFEKAVYDAMNKRVFKDDSQIQLAVVGKRWAREGEEPHISVTIATQSDRSWTKFRPLVKKLWDSVLG
jgi:Holliday junction resolvase RusA-like endonuclease